MISPSTSTRSSSSPSSEHLLEASGNISSSSSDSQELNVSIISKRSGGGGDSKQASPISSKTTTTINASKKSSGFSIDDLISSEKKLASKKTRNPSPTSSCSSSIGIDISNTIVKDKACSPNNVGGSFNNTNTNNCLLRVSPPSMQSSSRNETHNFQHGNHQIYSTAAMVAAANLFGHSLNSPDSVTSHPHPLTSQLDHVKASASTTMMWSASSPSCSNLVVPPPQATSSSYSNNSMQSSSSPSSSITSSSSSSSSSSSNMMHRQSPISPSNSLNMQLQQQQSQAQMPPMSDPQLSALHFHLQREQTLNMLRNGARFFDPRYSLPRKLHKKFSILITKKNQV